MRKWLDRALPSGKGTYRVAIAGMLTALAGGLSGAMGWPEALTLFFMGAMGLFLRRGIGPSS